MSSLANRAFSSLIVGAILFNQTGCGSPEPEASELHDSALGDALGLSSDLQKYIEIVGDVATAVSGVAGMVGAVDTFLELFGIVESKEAQILKKLEEINAKLDKVLAATMAGFTLERRRAVDAQVGRIVSANTALIDYLRRRIKNIPVTPQESAEIGFQTAALKEAILILSQESYSERIYDEQAVSGLWTMYIPRRAEVRNGAVFDHRMALPAMLQGITVHLLWMSALDPNFHQNGNYAATLREYAAKVRGFADRMRDGVTCSKMPDHWHVGFSALPAGCVDIYTGISTVDNNWLQNENARSPIVPYTRENIVPRYSVAMAKDDFKIKTQIGVISLYQLAQKLDAYTVETAPAPKPPVSVITPIQVIKPEIWKWFETVEWKFR